MKRTYMLVLFLAIIFISLIAGKIQMVNAETDTSNCTLCHQTNLDDFFNLSEVNREETCISCHIAPQHGVALVKSTVYGNFQEDNSPWLPQNELHQIHNGSNLQASSRSCKQCHGRVACTACHNQIPHINHSQSDHANREPKLPQSDGINSVTKVVSCANANCHSYDPPVRTRSDGGELCINCHDGSEGSQGHKLDVIHAVYLNPPPVVDCFKCHEPRLDEEHDGKILLSGNVANCATCHKSQDTKVTNAVKDGKRECANCHELHQDDITVYHNVYETDFIPEQQYNCRACHATDLPKEHYLRNYDCNACHNSHKQTVRTAVYDGEVNCLACHADLHSQSDKNCYSCHQSEIDQFSLTPRVIKKETCVKCHASASMSEGHSKPSWIGQRIGELGIFRSMDSVEIGIPEIHTYHNGMNLPAGSNACAKCHGKVNCSTCHTQVIHKDHSTSEITTPIFSVVANGVKSEDNVTISCANSSCHNAWNWIKKERDDGLKLCFNCHNPQAKDGHGDDISGKHLVETFLANGQSSLNCQECHARNLKEEHYKSKRLASVGKQMDCDTCHKSTDLNVKAAIKTDKKNCDACHITRHGDDFSVYHAVYDSVYENVYRHDYISNQSYNCGACHIEDIRDEHMVRNKNCDTCHASTRSEVRETIISGKRYCNSCHELLHSQEDIDTDKYINCNSCHSEVIGSFMPVATVNKITACKNCHTGFHQETPHETTPSGKFISSASLNIKGDMAHEIHKGKSVSEDNSCKLCHGLVNCQTCHNGSILHNDHSGTEDSSIVLDVVYGTGVSETPITCATANCHGYPTDLDSIKVKNEDETVLCWNCHQPAAKTGHDNIFLKHNISAYYVNQGTSNLNLNCQDCHKNNLKVEHVDSGNKYGQLMRCDTCHKSETQTVKDAIYQNKTSCDSCHMQLHTEIEIPHKSTYTQPAQVSCKKCHSDLLHIEHQNKALECKICHQSNRDDVKDAVAAEQRLCSACHTIHKDPEEAHDSKVSCSPCHTNMLDDEHLNKTDNQGKSYTCDTCHDNPTVASAIENHQNKCEACHSSKGHTDEQLKTVHNSVYTPEQGKPFSCDGCHNNRLDEEHSMRKVTCAECHDSSNLKVREAIANKDTKCTACHEQSTLHSGSIAGHDTLSYVNNPSYRCLGCHNPKLDLEHATKKDDNGKVLNCTTCHNSNNSKVQNAIKQKNNKCDACHLIHEEVNQIHESSMSFEKDTCMNCHNSNLVKEHSTCSLCHKSDNPKVLKAMREHRKACFECHDFHSDIDEKHVRVFPSGYQMDCKDCHNQSMTIEHQDRLDNQGKELGCSSCHSSKNPEIKRLMKNKDIESCNSCHMIHKSIDESHRSNYVDSLDINCTPCHSNLLNREHLSGLHTKDKGYTCATCHKTNNEKYKKAIKENKSNCDACHQLTHKNTEELSKAHTVGFNQYSFACEGCHNAVLNKEHDTRQVGGKTGSCKACHDSDVKLVIASIKENRKECSSCHQVHKTPKEAHWSLFEDNKNTKCSTCHAIHKPPFWRARPRGGRV